MRAGCIRLSDSIRCGKAHEVARLTMPGYNYVVSVNGKVVPRSEYGATTLEDNDEVKVIHLVAGG